MAITTKAKAPEPGKAEPGKLDASAWIREALTLLAEQGIDGVRVEPLAKRLGVTKGSFYWHFKDRNALFEAMLTDWRRRATLGIIDRIDSSHEPAEKRFRTLLRLPLAGRSSERGADVELSVRLWGRRDPAARAALEEVDQLRLRYITGLLQECGVPAHAAPARALLAYAYMRVAASLVSSESAALMEQCEDALMAGEG